MTTTGLRDERNPCSYTGKHEPIDSHGNTSDNQRLAEIILVTWSPGPPVDLLHGGTAGTVSGTI